MRAPALAALALLALVAQAARADTAAQVADINPGNASGVNDVHHANAIFGGELYFVAQSTSNDAELWRYDGVNPPTLAASINPSGGSSPLQLTTFGDQLCFAASDAALDRELYCYDGVDPPVKINVNPTTFSSPINLVQFQDQLYFVAQGDSMGLELWRYDGTHPPVRVTDLATGSLSAFGNDVNDDMLVWNGLLYFVAADSSADREVYSYDGASPPVKISNSVGSAAGDSLVVAGRYLCFSHGDSSSGGQNRAWCYDGVEPPFQLSPTLAMQGDLASFAGDLYMWAYEQAPGSETGTEMWRWDGSAITRVAPNVGTTIGLPSWRVFAGALYFINGAKLYRFDGVSPPVQAVPTSHPIDGFVPFAGRLFFTGTTTAAAHELWELQPSSPDLFDDGFEKHGAWVWSASEGLTE